jgi:hypothetical protein
MALLLAAVVAPSAQATAARCPTITDDAGDSGFVAPIPDADADLTAVDVSSSKRELTARLTIVGQPTLGEPASGHVYDVYFDTGEGSYVFRASLANGEARYELLTYAVTDSGAGAGLVSFQPAKNLSGRLGSQTITMTAPLAKDLPLAGRSVTVFGRTWRSAADAMPLAGTRGPYGVNMTLDDTDEAPFRVGDAGCPTA